ncbi:MAG TPA: gliding motility-associated ABC transporter substrate-binding protein GldG [Bacteroidia bacterium]|nr:gliding motility-associated ABC transporter substrate-binding protein GldG [Bacteroidia bacterium]
MVKELQTKRRSLKSQNVIQLFLLLCILILINVISSFVFTRFDLTSEKRYTLSDATKNVLKKLPDVVYVKVYLTGDLPGGFRHLENSVKEMLDEMRVYAGDNLQYEFIDPSSNPDKNTRTELYKQLYKKGLQPTNIQESEKEKTSEKVIWPGAIVTYRANEIPMQLLNDQLGAGPEQALNSSVEGLEFSIGNTIRKITVDIAPSIAFIEGHGEMNKKYTADIYNTLKNTYNVEWKKIDGKLNALANYQAILIAKPDSVFDEKDKFIIDQFIMKGGKAVWLIDPMTAEMDSLADKNDVLATARELNLDDMLFRYGVRINYDLVQDLQSVPIPMVVGYSGGRPQQKLLPWFYFPLVFPGSKHPIVNNLNAIRFQFASTIDTVGSRDLKKTVLLSSSKYTRVVKAPARISLEMLRKEPDMNMFNQPDKILAVLVEGTFPSNFTNRIPPVIAEDKDIGFKETSVPTKMVVVSDGDVIRNDYRKSSESPMPLGYDRYTGQTYGNKNFLLNVIDYLCDDSGLITVRSKEIKLRLLDKTLITTGKTFWQVLNTVLPLFLILVFGFVKGHLRRRRFAG